MTVFQWIRFLFGAVLALGGLFFFITSVVGNFRFPFVLYRMHAAGVADTFGLSFLFLGLAVLAGSVVFALKLVLIILLFWIGSAAVSHLILRMEMENGTPADGDDRKKGGGRK